MIKEYTVLIDNEDTDYTMRFTDAGTARHLANEINESFEAQGFDRTAYAVELKTVYIFENYTCAAGRYDAKLFYDRDLAVDIAKACWRALSNKAAADYYDKDLSYWRVCEAQIDAHRLHDYMRGIAGVKMADYKTGVVWRAF